MRRISLSSRSSYGSDSCSSLSSGASRLSSTSVSSLRGSRRRSTRNCTSRRKKYPVKCRKNSKKKRCSRRCSKREVSANKRRRSQRLRKKQAGANKKNDWVEFLKQYTAACRRITKQKVCPWKQVGATTDVSSFATDAARFYKMSNYRTLTSAQRKQLFKDLTPPVPVAPPLEEKQLVAEILQEIPEPEAPETEPARPEFFEPLPRRGEGKRAESMRVDLERLIEQVKELAEEVNITRVKWFQERFPGVTQRNLEEVLEDKQNQQFRVILTDMARSPLSQQIKRMEVLQEEINALLVQEYEPAQLATLIEDPTKVCSSRDCKTLFQKQQLLPPQKLILQPQREIKQPISSPAAPPRPFPFLNGFRGDLKSWNEADRKEQDRYVNAIRSLAGALDGLMDRRIKVRGVPAGTNRQQLELFVQERNKDRLLHEMSNYSREPLDQQSYRFESVRHEIEDNLDSDVKLASDDLSIHCRTALCKSLLKTGVDLSEQKQHPFFPAFGNTPDVSWQIASQNLRATYNKEIEALFKEANRNQAEAIITNAYVSSPKSLIGQVDYIQTQRDEIQRQKSGAAIAVVARPEVKEQKKESKCFSEILGKNSSRQTPYPSSTCYNEFRTRYKGRGLINNKDCKATEDSVYKQWSAQHCLPKEEKKSKKSKK
jgi:hypothetical protein